MQDPSPGLFAVDTGEHAGHCIRATQQQASDCLMAQRAGQAERGLGCRLPVPDSRCQNEAKSIHPRLGVGGFSCHGFCAGEF